MDKLKLDYGPKSNFLDLEDSTSILKSQPVDYKRVLGGDTFNATWLGHASCLFRMGTIGIVTDPVFNEVVGPPVVTQLMGPKRYLDPPTSVTSLMSAFDVVFSFFLSYLHLFYSFHLSRPLPLLNNSFLPFFSFFFAGADQPFSLRPS